MKKIEILLTIMACGFLTNAYAQTTTYKAPPSSVTRNHVPVISDEKMEECVEIYNKAEWLGEKLNNQVVDSYSQESVDKYNKEVGKHSALIDKFNRECAGKQSRSACEAAQKLNRQNGLPVTKC